MNDGSMRRISSRWTFFYKKVFPVIWFGPFGLLATVALLASVLSDRGSISVLGPAVIMVFFGYIVMRRFIWDLVDEVYDGGDFLLVKNRGEQYRLPLTDIINVSSTIAVNPPRITLQLTGPSSMGPLGARVVFSPKEPFTLNPFAESRVAADLILRIHAARSNATNRFGLTR
jgi:hypothetical protein